MTLNKVIQRLKSIALSHKQIRFFFLGDPHEFDANGEITYAACFIELMPSAIDRGSHTITYRFRIYLYDLVPESTGGEINETEVISDMDAVAADLIALLANGVYGQDWTLETPSTVNQVTEQLNDLVAGVQFEIGISVDYSADSCAVPDEDIEPDNDFDMARTKLLEYVADGTEGDTFVIPSIAGLNVVGIFRAGSFRKPVITRPTDSERVGVIGSDGGVKGVYATTGEVQLQSGDALVYGEKLNFLYHG